MIETEGGLVFEDPSRPEDFVPRESVEARTLVVFDTRA
jgi:hypothetical protein